MKTKVILLTSLIATPVMAEAPRGSSYATPYVSDEPPPPLHTLVQDAEAPAADLSIKGVAPKPKHLAMRPKRADGKTTVAKADGDAADTATEPTGTVGIGYKMFPTTTRDLRDRVTFRIRAGVEVDTAPASGETLRGGFPLPGDFTDTRPWIAGDAIIGARGIVTPSLNGYFLSSFAFDASDSLATRAATIRPGDSFGEEIAIKAGYAEYGREDRKPDDQQPPFWLRAGRQFRLDGGTLFAYFDGATIGYRQPAWNLSAFVGQRVALYVDTEPGILFGGTFSIDLKKAARIPGRIWANYTGLSIASTDYDGAVDANGVTSTDTETRHLVNVGATAKLAKKMKLDAHVRITGLPDVANTEPGQIPADKFALGNVGGRVEYDTGRVLVIADVQQRFKDDLAYDLASPAQADIVDVANKIGVLSQPINATQLGLKLDWQNAKRSFEVIGFTRAELPQDTPTTVDNKTYVEAGAAIAGSPIGVRGSGVYTTVQYRFRQYTDEGEDGGMRIDGTCLDFTDANMDGIPDNCQEFGNSASSGLDRMQELAAEAALSTKSNSGQRWRFGAGAFFRVYDIQTPYREVTNDARGGGRLDLKWWFSRDLHLDVAGELAQSSPTLARDLGVLTSIRAAVEARW